MRINLRTKAIAFHQDYSYLKARNSHCSGSGGVRVPTAMQQPTGFECKYESTGYDYTSHCPGNRVDTCISRGSGSGEDMEGATSALSNFLA